MPEAEDHPDAVEIADYFIAAVEPWYESKRADTGRMNTNVMTIGLMLTEHMSVAFPLAEAQYLTSGGGQVKALSGSRIRGILAQHGEVRPFTSEGGRTSRGTISLARELADALNASSGAIIYVGSDDDVKTNVRQLLQGWFVQKVRADFFDRQRVTAELDSNKPSRRAIAELLKAARERGGPVAGAVAQHLVGAKLSLRFPQLDISNETFSTGDRQTARPGDFLVGDTAIHVTVSPSEKLMSERCRNNLANNFRPLVLVPEDRVIAARQLADNASIADLVAVSSVEEFVGTNIEEIGGFTAQGIRTNLRGLLETYNRRVQAVEPDPSLQIEIPGNL